jgi:ribosomal protein S18 acetylase RimI-like enzyme
MSVAPDLAVRRAEAADAETIGQLLHDFNYVVPDRRGQGLGRALMEAAIEFARREGAAHMDLGTSEDDVAARALYESLGFSNREGRPEGPVNYFYEREL